MNDAVTTQAILVFWAAMFAGLGAGGLAGWRGGLMWGVGVGGLVIGAGGMAGAGWLGWHRYRSLADSEVAQGVIVDHVVETSTIDGERTSMRAPVVRFQARDGRTYEVKGLGSSQATAEPGDAVPVRYLTRDPRQAVIADFQNEWGGVWGLGLFGVVPAMMGAFFLATAIGERRRRPAIVREPSPRRAAVAGWLTIAGNVVILGGFAAGLLPETVAAAIGVTFLGVAAGCSLHAAAQVVAPRGGWQALAILVLVGVTFALFGLGIYAMG
jgi:Protein of unknown function (DUF3592)